MLSIGRITQFCTYFGHCGASGGLAWGADLHPATEGAKEIHVSLLRKRQQHLLCTGSSTVQICLWASNFAHQRPRILVHKNYCQTGAVGMWPPQYVKLPTFILTALLTCEIIALWRLISMVRSLTWSRLSSSPIFFLGFGRYALWHGPLNKRQAENELAASWCAAELL